MNEITFENLESADRCLAQHADDIGYVSLGEVVSRHKAHAIARVDFTVTSLAPYFTDGPPGLLTELPMLDEVSGADLARAVGRWVRRTVEENMAGRNICKFKLCIWGPKGDTLLHSLRFIARRDVPVANPEDDEDETTSGITSPAPTMPAVQSGVLPPDASAWQALSGAYVHFASLLQSGYAHLFGLQNNAVVVLTSDNQRLRRTLEDAYGDLAKLRIGNYEIESEQRQEVGSTKVREELGRQFISELGALGRVVASAKLGMPAELVELIDLVNSTPELAEAIRDPEVRKVLRDEKTRKELAALLRLAAQTPSDKPKAA